MAQRPDNAFNPPNVAAIREAMGQLGVERIFIKRLAANDNSKQQIYLGSDLSVLPPIPRHPVEAVAGTSSKPGAAGKPIFRVRVDWYWLDNTGNPQIAPRTKLIYYPQFPEIRLSGFLFGSAASPSSLMQPTRRLEGRYLLFGVSGGGRIIATVVAPDTPVAQELSHMDLPRFNQLFFELSATAPVTGNSRTLLIAKLREVNKKGWITAKRLQRDGNVVQPYESQNSGGYTLEAEFGVIPNGNADPDYLGWELKQFRLPDCASGKSAVLTLMTPEPDGGYYQEEGAEAFVRRYGYASREIADRLDFTGRHKVGTLCTRTETTLLLEGVDPATGRLLSANGGLLLVRKGEDHVAARWSFAKLLEHWQHKHQQAVYVPSLTREGPKAHFFCPVVRLAEGTAFPKLLKVLVLGHAYYDPALKIERASSSSSTKRRSQFRIGTRHLENIYDRWERIDVTLDSQG